MNKYNFETRELCPYRKDWDKNGNFWGALWYVKEKDGIYLLDTLTTRPISDKSARPYNELLIAKGLPAAILAQDDLPMYYESDYSACYQAYFKVIKELFPTKPVYDIPTVLDEWEFCLAQRILFDNDPSGHLDNYSFMAVGVFVRGISNPYRENELKHIIDKRYHFTCSFPNQETPQLIFSQMPHVEDRTEAPLIYSYRIDQPLNTAKLQASGFMAAIINLAVFYYWKRRWAELNFADIEWVKRINQVYKRLSPIVEVSDIHKLSFNLPIEVEDICKAYMEAFEPIMRKVWKMKPEVQLECIEEDNIYTYIYKYETDSPDQLFASELYANLTNEQKRTLYSYGRRFLEWMVKTYSITALSQHKVLQAMTKDWPPIQVTIKNNVKVTHAGEEEKPKKKQAKPKAKTTTKVPKATKETTCPYINGEELAKKGIYTVDDFQKKLRHACEQEAKVLVDFLIEHEKYGNLDFHGANMKAIYTTLRSKCFPTMRDYSYQNFAAAWKEALKSVA